MKIPAVFIIFFVLTKDCAKQKHTQATLGIHDRVALLKQQITQEIKKKNFASQRLSPIDNEDLGANYEYVDNADEPITPIMNYDKRKQKDSFKLKQIKTTPEAREDVVEVKTTDNKNGSKISADDKDNGNADKPHGRNKHLRSKKRIKAKKFSDIFYRRIFPDDVTEYAQKWTHCQDLITPFITGAKTNMTVPKRLNYDDHVVLRLVQLLSEDMTGHTKDDIYSILYQISNLQLRLFQWDISAIKLLFNTIDKDNKRHTFRSLKAGIKRMFQNWHLDIANTTNLLKQARLFRPPCYAVSSNEGSTKTSKTIRYTKSVKPKKCSDEDEDLCLEGY